MTDRSDEKVKNPADDKIKSILGDIHQQQNMYTPIKSLNTFLFDWKIKGRVTKKQAKKSWKNAKGTGTLLNIEIIDNQGIQIQATFFNDQADKYDELLKENKVYLFSNGTVKMANQKYTSIKNDFCIVFDRNSEIKEVADDDNISAVGFSFTTIDEINEFEQMRTVDAIGVVTQITPITKVNIKSTGLEKDRRNVSIVDESGLQIQISLWGGLARRDEYREGQVIALKGSRVSDYGGKSLNSGDEHSLMFIDPEHKRT